MSQPGYLRIGNAERQEAIVLLQRAAAEGRLTPDELDERAARAQAAVTYADLDLLFADLPVPPPSERFGQPFAGSRPERPGWSPDHRLALTAGISRERRRGPWEIPPFVRVSGDFGSVLLDCRQATCLAPVIDIDVAGGAGSVRIIVPDGWGVNTEQVTKGWGTLRNRVQSQPDPGQPLLMLHGTAGVGSVRIRAATSQSRRRRQRGKPGRTQLPSGWVAEHPDMPNADDLR